MLLLQFFPGICDEILRLSGKSDQDTIPLERSDLPDNVGISLQFKGGRGIQFLQLLLAREFRVIIGNSCGLDDNGTLLIVFQYRFSHLGSRPHRNKSNISPGNGKMAGATNQRYIRPPPPGHLRQGKSHPSRRSVCNKANRIDGLMGGTCGYENPISIHVFLHEEIFDPFHDIPHRGQSSLPDDLAGQIPFFWTDKLVTGLF